MKKIFLFSFLTLILLSFTQKKVKVKFEELGYGITKSKGIIKNELNNSPRGNHLTFGESKIVKVTDSIPAELGNQFGIFYKLHSKKNKDLKVNIIWTYPNGMTDLNGKQISETSYFINKTTNIESFSNYTLEGENELVKGIWTFTMKLDNKTIYVKDFYLY